MGFKNFAIENNRLQRFRYKNDMDYNVLAMPSWTLLISLAGCDAFID